MAVIRDVVEADIPIFFEQQRDPEARRMAVFPEREQSEFTAHWQKILASDDVTKKTILAGREVAGNIVCFDRDDKRLVGYWLGREFWGQGLATRALAELLVGDRKAAVCVRGENQYRLGQGAREMRVRAHGSPNPTRRAG